MCWLSRQVADFSVSTGTNSQVLERKRSGCLATSIAVHTGMNFPHSQTW